MDNPQKATDEGARGLTETNPPGYSEKVPLDDRNSTNGVITKQAGFGPAVEVPPGMNPEDPRLLSCPRGLEYLMSVDQVLMHQEVHMLEVFSGWECKNRFSLKNSLGQQMFYAAEESECCNRYWCKNARGFVMHIVDNQGQEIMRVTREFKCCVGCCWCINCCDHCAFEVSVESPVGNVIGYIKQAYSKWKPIFEVKDVNHETHMTLRGPCCICSCPCFDVEFNLFSMEGDVVGQVSKQWSGLAKEVFTQAQNFGITFPMDLDVKVKATLIGAVFLINMMFFENNGN